MRVLIAILTVCALTFAGCTAPVDTPPPRPAPPGPDPASAPDESSGIIWFPPPDGLGGGVVKMPLDIPVAGAGFRADYQKQSSPGTVGPARPADAASAMVRLLAADGALLGEVMLPWNGPTSGQLEVPEMPLGEHTLVFTLYGVSAADRLGHHLAYRHQVHLPEGS